MSTDSIFLKGKEASPQFAKFLSKYMVPHPGIHYSSQQLL
jgi:hypothetical protein